MNAQEIKKALAPIFIGEGFGTWEADDLVRPIARLEEDVQFEILHQVTVIWPVSQALTFLFLGTLSDTLGCLNPSQLPEWVNSLLDSYESEGLRGARKYIADIEDNFLCRIRGEGGLSFEQASRRLLPYGRGLVGRNIDLIPSGEVHTDTSTIHLPAEVGLFKDEERNYLVYKLIIAHQWAYMAFGTIRPGRRVEMDILSGLPGNGGTPSVGQGLWLDSVLRAFRERDLALEIYHLLETARTSSILRNELPGLMRDTEEVRSRLLRMRPVPNAGDEMAQVMEGLRQWVLAGKTRVRFTPHAHEIYEQCRDRLIEVAGPGRTVRDTVKATFTLYGLLEELDGASGGEPLLYQGHLKTAQILRTIKNRREHLKKTFIEAMAALFAVSDNVPAVTDEEISRETPDPVPVTTGEEAAALLMVSDKDVDIRQAQEEAASPEFIQLGEQSFEIPEEMQMMVKEIQDDLGEVPGRYISSALDMAGRSGGIFEAPEPGAGARLSGESVYNEWDFRRQGFRKNWCRLLELDLDPAGGTFVTETLRKYRGLIHSLKRQFELIKTQDRFLKRQKDGDDLDLDALVEALSDMKAGLEPSQRLFVRLLRDQRSIAAVFLVDMSASTEGWISTALKESLVLMCEALDVLGDSYAIYGFSGMRRTRSELYRIKEFEDRYDEVVKGRITAISPRDYTRMGPPLRHLTEQLKSVEAKVRLIITLSDGKPEDYDDYKGRYAVEDTRHALIEAKAAGIHPFCITIDQHAQEYISHMYGEVNYIFIDDVRKLPLRIPEIYRALTT